MRSNQESTHPSHATTSHPHPLWETECKEGYKCDGCKMRGVGQRPQCQECDYDLHPQCLNAPLTKTFRGMECIFLEKPLDEDCRSCDACGKDVEGFVYYCEATWMDFHPLCTNLPTQICIDDVVFRLVESTASRNSKCQWCNKKALKGSPKNIPGWSYVSNHNDYNFHVYCVMDMVLKSSSNSNSNSIYGEDLSLAILEGFNLPLGYKSKETSCSKCSKCCKTKKRKWLKILGIFLKTVISILVGDPTTIVTSALANTLTQVLLG